VRTPIILLEISKKLKGINYATALPFLPELMKMLSASFLPIFSTFSIRDEIAFASDGIHNKWLENVLRSAIFS
jgi:hypothetical protein